MSKTVIRIALLLGLLSALGPFAIDMYLPGLPAIGEALHADPASVQLSLAAFIAASSLSQLVFGPVSDIVGRRRPMLFGLTLFALSSVGCALAGSIETLIAFRALQGIGASAGMVIPRAVVRDLHTGREAVRLMALLMLVFAVSPILAPLFGSFVVARLGWRSVFWCVGAAALVGIVVASLKFPETRSEEARQKSSWSRSLADYGELIRDPRFLGLSAIVGFATAAFMVYLANSSFVLMGRYGLSPGQYSVFFSLNAAAMIGAAQVNSWLVGRHSLMNIMRGGVAGFAAAMILLLILSGIGIDSLAVMTALLFVGYACMGLVMPNATVLALDMHGAIAGTASALIGAMQMFIGSLMMAVASYFADGSPLHMIAGIAASAVCSLAATLIFSRSARREGLPNAREPLQSSSAPDFGGIQGRNNE